jgi:hypothetical protein
MHGVTIKIIAFYDIIYLYRPRKESKRKGFFSAKFQKTLELQGRKGKVSTRTTLSYSQKL